MPQTPTRSRPRADFWRDPALPFVESRRARDSRACYAEHTHASLSLGLVEGGRSISRVAGRTHALHAGHVVGIPAGMVHACNPLQDGRWSYRMLYLDPAWVSATLAEEGLSPVPLDAAMILRDARAFTHLQQADEGLRAGDDPVDAETRLIDSLRYLVARKIDTCNAPLQPRLQGAALRNVLDLLDARCHERLPLSELAAVARLSRAHLARAFRHTMGMSPHAWQLDRRIERAKPLLLAGVPLAEVALQLGFSDQSHFQRAFKQRVAATPLEYLRRR